MPMTLHLNDSAMFILRRAKTVFRKYVRFFPPASLYKLEEVHTSQGVAKNVTLARCDWQTNIQPQCDLTHNLCFKT